MKQFVVQLFIILQEENIYFKNLFRDTQSYGAILVQMECIWCNKVASNSCSIPRQF